MATQETLPLRFHDAYARLQNGVRHNHLSPDDRLLFGYRMHFRDKLQQELQGHFYVGTDIGTADDVTIGADSHAIVPIAVIDTLFQQISTHPYAFSTAYATTRSRFAQLGLEVSADAGKFIAETAVPIEEDNPSQGYFAQVL